MKFFIHRAFLFLILFVVCSSVSIPRCGKAYTKTLAYAETLVSVDLEKLPSDAARAILNQNKEKQKAAVPIEDRMTKWLELGRGLGSAVAETGLALNMQANEFAKSSLGKWAIAVLTWKLLGKEILGVLLVALLYIFLFMSFRRFHLNERVVYKEKIEGTTEISKRVEYIPRFKFKTTETAFCSAAVHALLFLGLSIVTLVQLLS